MTDEQRQAFRERMMSMTPEQRQQMFQRTGGGGGEGGARLRRPAQPSPDNETRWRIATIRHEGTFKPRLIKVGPSNFEQSVVLKGVQEGDEVEIITISRAKIAQEAMNERMRSMNSFGGGTNNAARAASGAGGRR
jgi:hypothetical protein